MRQSPLWSSRTAALLSLLAVPSGLAAAQEDSAIQRLEATLQRLESQHQAELKALQAEINDLKAKQAETDKQIQAQAPTPERPQLIESPTHQFGSPACKSTAAIIFA